MKKVKNVAISCSRYFENNKFKNETTKIAKNVTKRCNIFLKISSVDHAENNHICISPKVIEKFIEKYAIFLMIL